MTELSRRELARGMAVVGAAMATSAVTACSRPSPEVLLEPHRRFFTAIARRDFAAANTLINDKTRLVIARTGMMDIFAGKNVVAPIANLLVTESLRFFGDSDEVTFAGRWHEASPWMISNLVPQGKIELGNCGSALASPILSVFVRGEYVENKQLLNQILLLESYNIATGFGPAFPEPPLPDDWLKKNG